MKFELSKSQIDRISEWVKILKKEPNSAIGGALTYQFTPTGLGLVVKAIWFDGSELDITEYENW